MEKLCIRADGGPKIGMGHIMRCVAIAREFRRNGVEVIFLTKINGQVRSILENNGFEYIEVKSMDIESEINEVIRILEQLNTDAVMTDSYWLSDRYLYELRQNVKLLISIDDNALYTYPSHIIINGNAHGTDLVYKTVFDDTEFLLGGQYTILREAFCNTKPIEIRKEVKRILITMGGSDINSFTPFIVESLKGLDQELIVVVGPGFSCVDELNKMAEAYSNVELVFNPTNMVEVMERCDLAISAAGSTTYELAVMGIPTLLIVQADNQEGIAKKMHDGQMMESLGWYEEIDGISLNAKVKELIDNVDLRSVFSQKSKNFISSQGVENIVNTVKTLSSQKNWKASKNRM